MYTCLGTDCDSSSWSFEKMAEWRKLFFVSANNDSPNSLQHKNKDLLGADGTLTVWYQLKLNEKVINRSFLSPVNVDQRTTSIVHEDSQLPNYFPLSGEWMKIKLSEIWWFYYRRSLFEMDTLHDARLKSIIALCAVLGLGKKKNKKKSIKKFNIFLHTDRIDWSEVFMQHWNKITISKET